VYRRRGLVDLFQTVWLERAIIACCCFAGSWWILNRLCVDRWFLCQFSFSIHCVWLWFGLWTRKGCLACYPLLQGVDGIWTRFCVDGRSNYRTEDLWLVLGLIRGWSTCVMCFPVWGQLTLLCGFTELGLCPPVFM